MPNKSMLIDGKFHHKERLQKWFLKLQHAQKITCTWKSKRRMGKITHQEDTVHVMSQSVKIVIPVILHVHTCS